MPSRSGTRSFSRSSQVRTGAGAMSTKPSSDITETSDLQGAFPRLSDAQITTLAMLGQRRNTEPGEILFQEGDRYCNFFVVLGGSVASAAGHGSPKQPIITSQPPR